MAAASVSFHRRVNEIAGEAIRLAMAARVLFPPQLVTNDIYSGQATTAAINAGLINKNWPISAGGFPQHPFGGDFRLQVFSSGNFISIMVQQLEHDECVAIMTKLSASAKTGEMQFILSNNGSINANTADFSAAAETRCAAAALGNISYVTAYFNR